MKWIECSKKLPPPYEDVLAYLSDEDIIIQAAWLPRWDKWEFGNGHVKIEGAIVTHWTEIKRKELDAV